MNYLSYLWKCTIRDGQFFSVLYKLFMLMKKYHTEYIGDKIIITRGFLSWAFSLHSFEDIIILKFFSFSSFFLRLDKSFFVISVETYFLCFVIGSVSNIFFSYAVLAWRRWWWIKDEASGYFVHECLVKKLKKQSSNNCFRCEAAKHAWAVPFEG